MALAVKEVGKSGQISIGKALVGTRFEIVQHANGDMLLRRVQVVPVSEAWAHTPEMKKKLKSVKQYIDQTPVSVIPPETFRELRESGVLDAIA